MVNYGFNVAHLFKSELAVLISLTSLLLIADSSFYFCGIVI